MERTGKKRNNGYLILILSILPLGLMLGTGCVEIDRTEDLDLVVVSISPQIEVVRSIAGNSIEVVVMVPENMDPHSYSPTPGQMLQVAKADMYFKMGSGIEFEELNMKSLRETNSEMTVVDLSESIDVVSFEDHGIDHSHDAEEDDHVNHGTDPHIWLDPNNMRKIADNVLQALIDQDPPNMMIFKNNHEVYISRLNDTIEEIEEELDPYSGSEFLSYHPAWGYFADAFDLVQIAVEENGREPGPQGIASLIDQANEHNITVIFVEPQFDTSTAKQIADSLGGKVVTVDPLSEDYLSNLLEIADEIVKGINIE